MLVVVVKVMVLVWCSSAIAIFRSPLSFGNTFIIWIGKPASGGIQIRERMHKSHTTFDGIDEAYSLPEHKTSRSAKEKESVINFICQSMFSHWTHRRYNALYFTPAAISSYISYYTSRVYTLYIYIYIMHTNTYTLSYARRVRCTRPMPPYKWWWRVYVHSHFPCIIYFALHPGSRSLVRHDKCTVGIRHALLNILIGGISQYTDIID